LPGDPLGARIFATNIEKTINFFRDEIEEHKINYDDNSIKDFIDVYLKEIKNKENNTNNQYTGMYYKNNQYTCMYSVTRTTCTHVCIL
jgi:cytochrome P450 family 2 subfamily U polypeptide 1